MLNELTLTEALGGLERGDFTSVDLIKACLDRIMKIDPKINAFITINDTAALAEAAIADERREKGETPPLLGIPVALKDLFITEGIETTAASNVLKGYIPQYNGTVVKRLKDAGAIIIGKTNCDAFAHGSSGENSDFGPTRNPYNLEHIPGGSTSGSPAAVGADMVFMATGTDTGGSIRLPAGFNNVVGLKPTYGRVSRNGVIAMSSSLDSIGHLTKTVEDNARILQITAGHDRFDGTTPTAEVPDYLKDLRSGVAGIKIGVPDEYFIEGLDPEIKRLTLNALSELESQGAELIKISLPHTKYAIEVYYITQTAEVSSNLARYDGIRFGNPIEF